jgi:hypothetical protein
MQIASLKTRIPMADSQSTLVFEISASVADIADLPGTIKPVLLARDIEFTGSVNRDLPKLTWHAIFRRDMVAFFLLGLVVSGSFFHK